MISYAIRTWGCLSCGYRQDFDPMDQELMTKHLSDVKKGILSGECPNGCPMPLEKMTDPQNKQKVNHFVMADFVAHEKELNDSPPQKIIIGKTSRLETDQEKSERVQSMVDDHEKFKGQLNKKDKDDLTAELLGQPALVRDFHVFRDETAIEKKLRIAEAVAKHTVATPEYIAEHRAKYEDK